MTKDDEDDDYFKNDDDDHNIMNTYLYYNLPMK